MVVLSVYMTEDRTDFNSFSLKQIEIKKIDKKKQKLTKKQKLKKDNQSSLDIFVYFVPSRPDPGRREKIT